MRCNLKKIIIAVSLAIVLVPCPTRISQKTVLHFTKSPNSPVTGLTVYQSWESYLGVFGSGSAERVTDKTGTVKFPARYAFGSVASRLFARVFTTVFVHTSAGSTMTISFVLNASQKVDFDSLRFRKLEPFETSGQYLDAAGRYYFPQIMDTGQQHVGIRGDFLTGSDITIPIE